MKPSFPLLVALLSIAACADAGAPPAAPPAALSNSVLAPPTVATVPDSSDRVSPTRQMDDRWVGAALYQGAGRSPSVDVHFGIADGEDFDVDDIDVELLAGEKTVLLVDPPKSIAISSTMAGGGTAHAFFRFSNPGTASVSEVVVHFRGATERFLVADMSVAPWVASAR